MSDPTARFEFAPILDEEVIQLFIVASTYGETLETPGQRFEEARARFIQWVDQEQSKVGKGADDQLIFDIRRINIAIRGGMKQYAAGELEDLETRLIYETPLSDAQKIRFQGDLDRFRIELG